MPRHTHLAHVGHPRAWRVLHAIDRGAMRSAFAPVRAGPRAKTLTHCLRPLQARRSSSAFAHESAARCSKGQPSGLFAVGKDEAGAAPAMHGHSCAARKSGGLGDLNGGLGGALANGARANGAAGWLRLESSQLREAQGPAPLRAP
eukprot:6188505-Pleurochrysis_carterae.AAC.4